MKKVFLIIIALITAVPVLAGDFDIYGDIKLGAWFERRESYYRDTVITIEGNDTNSDWGKDSIPIFLCNWIPHGFLGFKVKGDRIGACVEIGVGNNLVDATTGSITNPKLYKMRGAVIYLGKWYTEFYISDFWTLLIGQGSAATNLVISNQAYIDHNSLTNMGCLATGNSPMIKMSFAGEFGNSFRLEGSLAALRTDTVSIYLQNQDKTTEIESKAPKAEIGFGVDFEQEMFAWNFKAAGGFQRYFALLRALPKDSGTVPIDAWVVGAEAGGKVGPVSIAYTVSIGKNVGCYGVAHGNPWSFRIGSATDPHIKDLYYPAHKKYDDTLTDSQGNDSLVPYWELKNSTLTQMAFVLKVKPWEFLSFETGAGMVIVEHEDDHFDEIWPGEDEWDWYYRNRLAWYFQAEATIAEVFKITPELGQFLWGPVLGNGGRYTYWGLMASIGF